MKTSFYNLLYCILIIAIAGSLSSCQAGAKCTVSAPRIEKPVSYTSCVFNNNGEIIKTNQDQVLKHFLIKKNFWAMLYRGISLTNKNWDISDLLDQQIAIANGNAIVNLTVKLRGDFYWYFSCLVPLIPDVQTLLIEGDVVYIDDKQLSK